MFRHNDLIEPREIIKKKYSWTKRELKGFSLMRQCLKAGISREFLKFMDFEDISRYSFEEILNYYNNNPDNQDLRRFWVKDFITQKYGYELDHSPFPRDDQDIPKKALKFK